MTKDVVVCELILSLPHATAIIKKFNQKKHRSANYFFELEDLGLNIWDREIDKRFPHLLKRLSDYFIPRFGDYGGDTAGYYLKVLRTRS